MSRKILLDIFRNLRVRASLKISKILKYHQGKSARSGVVFPKQTNRKWSIVYRHQLWSYILRPRLKGTNTQPDNGSGLYCQDSVFYDGIENWGRFEHRSTRITRLQKPCRREIKHLTLHCQTLKAEV